MPSYAALICCGALLAASCKPKPVDIAQLEQELRQKYDGTVYTLTVTEKEVCGGIGDQCPKYEQMEKAGWLTLEREAEQRVKISVTPAGRKHSRVEVEPRRNLYHFDVAHRRVLGVEEPTPGTIISKNVKKLEVKYRYQYVLTPGGAELKKSGWKFDDGPQSTSTTFERTDGGNWHMKRYHEGSSHPPI
jgi:hypothetical protein